LHFGPFKAHPNVILQILTQPQDLAGWLDALQLEVNRRFKFLAEAGAENWTLAPAPKAPRLLVVVDDFSILGDMLDATQRRALWLATRRLAADSRKSGIHLALAVQNPTWQSLDLGIRRNCTPWTFRVNDGDASRVILNTPGAEVLGKRQFLTVLGGLERGVAFAPTDEQIVAFLEHHPVPALPKPEWLPASGSPSAAPEAPARDQAERIRALYAGGKSLNAIQTEVFGYRGGAAYAAVKAAISDTEG
jgi:S-DNA-T family DNA segregation ATPase FtsK/SpoIIIE